MAAISITRTMRQLDGEYGCKAVRRKDKDGNEVVVLKKKNFFDRVLDVLCNLEFHCIARREILEALDKIAEEISNAESGKFKALLNDYKNFDKKIDFKEIKGTLAESLSWEFPPEIFSRKEQDDAELFSRVDEYKAFHLKNMRKSIILEKSFVPLQKRTNHADVSDENIMGFFIAAKETLDRTDQVIMHDGSRLIELRVKLAQIKRTAAVLRSTNTVVEERKKKLELRLETLREVDKKRKSEIELKWKKVYCKNLDELYVSRLREAVNNGSYQIEVVVEFDGGISTENINALTKARVQLEQSLNGKKIAVSIGEGASESRPDIEKKLCDAYVDYKYS